jgi:catechol-2,3-dioxygenase
MSGALHARQTQRMDLRWDAVVIDCKDPDLLATFWCALLDVEVRGRWEQFVGLHPMAPGQPRLVLQLTDDPRPTKNSVHVDLHVPSEADLQPAVDRATGLGATLVQTFDVGAHWRTLADPEGNLFCLVAD